MDEGIACIVRLKDVTQNSAELFRLAHLVHDAFRFVKQFCAGIEKNPLQVYSSVVFAPTRSIIKDLYQHEVPHWWSMQMAPPQNDDWSKCLQTIELNESCQIATAAFSSDGKALVLSLGMGIIQVRDADTGGCINVLEPGWGDFSILATSGGSILAVASEGDVFLFNILTGKEVEKMIETGETKVSSVAFAPNGAILATGSTEGGLLLWDMQTHECVRTLEANNQRGSIESIVFSSNGLYVAAAVNNNIAVWDLNTGWQLRTFVGHEGKVVLVAFAPDNYHVQSASSDGAVKVWDMTNSAFQTINIPIEKWTKVAFSTDLNKLASMSSSFDRIQIWDSTTGYLLGTLDNNGDVDFLAFSPDDAMLMSATYWGGTVKLWDVRDYMETSLMAPSQEDQCIFSMAFSSDGTQLTVVSGSAVQIWDANTGQCLRKLDGWETSRGVASVTFGNDGILLAIISEGKIGVAEIWNVCTKTCLQSLADERVSGSIEELVFAPDNATLAILTEDTVSLWDAAEGICRVVYNRPHPYFWSNDMKFSETGSHLYNYDSWKDGENAIRWVAHTDTAYMGIEIAPLEPLHISGYSIQDSQAWIRKNGEDIIWIPPEYRTSTYATRGPMMALGYVSGRVIFLRFT